MLFNVLLLFSRRALKHVSAVSGPVGGPAGRRDARPDAVDGSFRKEPVSVRFVSVPEFSKVYRFDSVRFEQMFFPLRRGSACVFRTSRGSVRFDSVRFRVRFRPVPELNGSVWFGSASSVRFLTPS